MDNDRTFDNHDTTTPTTGVDSPVVLQPPHPRATRPRNRNHDQSQSHSKVVHRHVKVPMGDGPRLLDRLTPRQKDPRLMTPRNLRPLPTLYRRVQVRVTRYGTPTLPGPITQTTRSHRTGRIPRRRHPLTLEPNLCSTTSWRPHDSRPSPASRPDLRPGTRPTLLSPKPTHRNHCLTHLRLYKDFLRPGAPPVLHPTGQSPHDLAQKIVDVFFSFLWKVILVTPSLVGTGPRV